MRIPRWTATVALLACSPNTRPPIFHLADHSDIAPDELGFGTPSASASASPIATTAIAASASASASAPEPPSPAEIASAAASCAPPAKPPAAPAVAHRIRSGPPVTNYIPPGIIMRPVRARAPCFRVCYLTALARDPGLRGRVVVHFVVEEDGWVRAARAAEGTDMPDDVAACVAAQFVGLAYPAPEGGRVQVHYPIAFEP